MLFTIGVESPDNEDQAFGMVIPALFYKDYSCFSAADEVDEILPQVTDAITLTLESMIENGIDITEIKDKGFSHYKTLDDFAFCDSWLIVDIDVSHYLGAKQQINVNVPEYLLNRMDRRIAALPNIYHDRNRFITTAIHRELHFHLRNEN